MSVETAFRVSVARGYEALRAALTQAPRGTVAHALLSSAIAQCEADVAGATRILERAAERAAGTELDYVIEVLGPLYVSADNLERLELLLTAPQVTPKLALSRETLRCVYTVRQRRAPPTSDLKDRVAAEDNGLLRARWQQRLAIAAYHADDFETASELALAAVRSYTAVGAGRGLAAAYSLLYAIHYVATGDLELALHYARLQEKSAKACGNESLEVAALVARYELAAEMGDHGALIALRRRLRARTLPQQYKERFARSVADVLYHAWAADFAAVYVAVTHLAGSAHSTPEERALYAGLQSLAEVGLGDAAAARRSARRALAHVPTGGRRLRPSAHARRYLHVAHGLAAATCLLNGDTVRGRRTFEKKTLRSDPAVSSLEAVADGADWRATSPRVRGYSRFVAAARDAAKPRRRAILSPAEHLVLQSMADGKTAGEIAEDLDRSISTIRAHICAIIRKLKVHGQRAALAKARKVGLVS